jgi:hypothetical protein
MEDYKLRDLRASHTLGLAHLTNRQTAREIIDPFAETPRCWAPKSNTLCCKYGPRFEISEEGIG